MEQKAAAPKQNEEQDARLESLKNWTAIVYLAQGCAPFFAGLPMLIGVAINYMKKSEVKGTWLESHFSWQLKTFWFTLILALVGAATLTVGIGHFLLTGAVIYLIFRVVRGWLKLNINRSIIEDEL